MRYCQRNRRHTLLHVTTQKRQNYKILLYYVFMKFDFVHQIRRHMQDGHVTDERFYCNEV